MLNWSIGSRSLCLLVIALGIAARSADADAQETCAGALLSWDTPTHKRDGSELDNLVGFRLYQSTESGGPYEQVADIADPDTTSHGFECLEPQTRYFWVATAYDTGGLESEHSNEATTVTGGGLVEPAPPTLEVIEREQTAYALAQSLDRIALVPVGTVPSGTPCDGDQAVKDGNGITGYVVPRSAVQWAGNVRSQVVYAECK